MTGALQDGLLIAAYGDDFTGSAAVMEVLEFAGLPTALFLDLPTPAQLARFPGLRAYIVAGTARAHGPDWMDANLPRLFAGLADSGAALVQYKVCSTLDSAPHMGSIGRAAELALQHMAAPWVPVLLAAPAIRRYQAFGHLFAAGPGGVYRLDQHPVMARHPVTPMDTSDVAAHLARQTDLPIGVLDMENLRENPQQRLAALCDGGARLICMDTTHPDDLAACGALIWDARGQGAFCIGSQGIEYALVAHWQRCGTLPVIPPPAGIGRADAMMAVSGSVSAVTAAQIDWAQREGFAVIPLDAAALLDMSAPDVVQDAIRACCAALSSGRNPLVCTARGPDDPALSHMWAKRDALGLSLEAANIRVGDALGRILAQVVRQTGLRRAVISGGDTSGHALNQCGIHALTALAPTIPGAAIFRAYSDDPAFDGLQIALKGGQMGTREYFGQIRDGGGTGYGA